MRLETEIQAQKASEASLAEKDFRSHSYIPSTQSGLATSLWLPTPAHIHQSPADFHRVPMCSITPVRSCEAQTRKLQDSLRDLEAKLESAITAREDVDVRYPVHGFFRIVIIVLYVSKLCMYSSPTG